MRDIFTYTVHERMTTAAVLNNTRDMEELLDGGAEIEAIDDQGMTALSLAVEHQSKKVIELLLRRGANPNTKNSNGWTPLHHAAFVLNTIIIGMLVDAGADACAKDNGGQTPRDRISAQYKVCLTFLKDGTPGHRPAQRDANNAPRMSP